MVWGYYGRSEPSLSKKRPEAHVARKDLKICSQSWSQEENVRPHWLKIANGYRLNSSDRTNRSTLVRLSISAFAYWKLIPKVICRRARCSIVVSDISLWMKVLYVASFSFASSVRSRITLDILFPSSNVSAISHFLLLHTNRYCSIVLESWCQWN